MELKNIFEMTKTDRYTQDGRDQIAKLAEDVKYKPGDISQKTGLQKQPDGSWAPPKKGARPGAKQAAAGSINRTPERIAKETAIMEALNLSTGEDNNLHKMSDETIERLYARTQEKPAAGKTTVRQGPNTKTLDEPPGEHIQKNLDSYRGYKPGDMEGLVLGPSGYKKQSSTKGPEGTSSITYTKEGEEDVVLFFDKYGELKNAGTSRDREGVMKKMQAAEGLGHMKVIGDYDVYRVTSGPDKGKYKVSKVGSLKEVTMSEQKAADFLSSAAVGNKSEKTKELMEKYKDLPGAQKKDALYAATFEGISIGQTQNQMERQGWDLISTGEDTGEDINVYGKPDGSKATMKHDGEKITSVEYEAPGSKDAAPKLRQLTGDCKIKIRPETQDKVYKPGEISEKTGLQKQPDGSWKPPRNGSKAAAETKKENPTRTFEFKAGPDGNPVAGSGKEVKTYKTKKEAQEALNKQKAESKPDNTREKLRKFREATNKKQELPDDLQKQAQEFVASATPERVERYIKALRTPFSRERDNFENPDRLAEALSNALAKKKEVESIGRDEKLNKVRQVLNTALTPSGDKVQMTKSKVTGDFHVLLNGKSTGGGFRDPQKAKEEFNAWIAGKKAPSESAKERINKRFDESEARSQKAMESKLESDFDDEGDSTGTNYQEKVEQNPRDGYNFEKMIQHRIPTSQTDKEELKGLRSFMNEEKATYQNALRSRAQALVDGHKSNGDWYPEKEQAIMKIAKVVGFDEELHKFIEEENRGYDLGYSEDAAPKIRELTGDCKIRIRK